jgi:Bacterial Ig-like domain
MRTQHALLTITMALSLAACQTTPNVPVVVDEIPGSSPTSSATLTMLTAQAEIPGEPLPLIGANAEWVAFQDGNGPWKLLEGSGGTYPFEVTNVAGKYGIAFVCPKSPGTSVLNPPQTAPPLEMRLFTLADLKAPRFGCNVPYSNSPSGTLPGQAKALFSGSFKGLEPSEYATLSLQNTASFRGEAVAVDANNQFFQQVPQGNYNVFATKQDRPLAGTLNTGLRYNKVILQRDLNLTATTVRNFDFATEGFVPDRKTVSLIGLQPGEDWNIYGGLTGLIQTFPSTITSVSLDAIPESLQGTDDVYGVRAYTNGRRGRDQFSRDVYTTSKSWPSSLTLPAMLAVQFKSAATFGSSLRWDRIVSSDHALQIRLVEASYSITGETTGQHLWQAVASSKWLNTTQTFVAPDFSGLAGWKPEWGFQKTSDLGWSVGIVQGGIAIPFLLSINDAVIERESTAAERAQRFKSLNFNISYFAHPVMDKLKPEITDIAPYADPSSPADGDGSGVPGDPLPPVTIIPKGFRVYFSETMDTTSVVAAYQSNILPANAVMFAWVPGAGLDRTLQIMPNQLLEKGKTYSFTIGAGAKDLAGNSIMAAKTYSHTVPQ